MQLTPSLAARAHLAKWDMAASAGAAWSAYGEQPTLWLLRMLELLIQQAWDCTCLCLPQHRVPRGPCAAWQSCSSWWRSARHAQLAHSGTHCCYADAGTREGIAGRSLRLTSGLFHTGCKHAAAACACSILPRPEDAAGGQHAGTLLPTHTQLEKQNCLDILLAFCRYWAFLSSCFEVVRRHTHMSLLYIAHAAVLQLCAPCQCGMY